MAKTLLEVLEENEIELKSSSGGRLVARCPFHDNDNEPSFTVYPTDTYFCFGCQVWGDAVKFLVDYRGLTAQEALENVGLDYKQPKSEKSKVIKVRNTFDTWRFLYDCVLQYHSYLPDGARNYLTNRGLKEETINTYKIGYTDGSVLNLKFAWERKLAEEIGLLNKKGYETMSHRITIPNLLGDEMSDFLIGRTVINDRIKYLGARMPKPLLGFNEVRKSPVIFLVEGQFDWLTLRQWGYPAICVGGTHLMSHLLMPLHGKELVIIPDYDDGQGIKAANKLLNLLGNPNFKSATILDYSSLRLDDSKLDISVLAERNDGEEEFREVLKEKLPWLQFLSKTILMKWFPALTTTQSYQLISSLQD